MPAASPPEVRLAKRLVRAENGCLEWQGATRLGYGRIGAFGRVVSAHRLAWELVRGLLTKDEILCHRCDNPRCCDVEHLFIGSKADNAADMVKKNRQAKGEKASRHKLTAIQVYEIRRRHAAGEMQARLAEEFGFSDRGMSSVIRGITWKHL